MADAERSMHAAKSAARQARRFDTLEQLLIVERETRDISVPNDLGGLHRLLFSLCGIAHLLGTLLFVWEADLLVAGLAAAILAVPFGVNRLDVAFGWSVVPWKVYIVAVIGVIALALARGVWIGILPLVGATWLLVEAVKAEGNAFATRAAIHFSFGRYDDGLAAVGRCLRFQPDHPRGWYYKALLLAGRGDTSEALDAAEVAVRLSPEDERASKLLEELRLRVALDTPEGFDVALSFLVGLGRQKDKGGGSSDGK